MHPRNDAAESSSTSVKPEKGEPPRAVEGGKATVVRGQRVVVLGPDLHAAHVDGERPHTLAARTQRRDGIDGHARDAAAVGRRERTCHSTHRARVSPHAEARDHAAEQHDESNPREVSPELGSAGHARARREAAPLEEASWVMSGSMGEEY